MEGKSRKGRQKRKLCGVLCASRNANENAVFLLAFFVGLNNSADYVFRSVCVDVIFIDRVGLCGSYR